MKRYFLLPILLAHVSLSFTAPRGDGVLCEYCGNGTDGVFTADSNTTLPGGIYNFSAFYIFAGATVKVTGNQPLIIYCTGPVVIEGILDASGANGTNGVIYSAAGVGGIGVAGGGKGGDGVYSSTTGPLLGFSGSGTSGGEGGHNWTGGGGAGHNGPGQPSQAPGMYYTFGGMEYGDVFHQFSAGSGGGGGSGGYNCGSGGGGGGGGFIAIYSCQNVEIYGAIRADGGNGGSDGGGNCGGGGGGSGGTIIIRGRDVYNINTISAKGGTGGSSSFNSTGGNGAPGRIRIDVYGDFMNYGTIIPDPDLVVRLPQISETIQHVSCHGGSDGSITINASGNIHDARYTLTTDFSSNNGYRGVMFNINVAAPVLIRGFDVNIDEFSSQSIQIFYKSGSHVGAETNSSAWTSLGNYTVTGYGLNKATRILLNIPLNLSPGNYAFAIYNQTSSTFRYIDGIGGVGSVWSQDNKITIYEGIGLGVGGPFGGDIYSPRAFSGSILYSFSEDMTFIYNWSTGDNTTIVDSLSAGDYSVFVVSNIGCYFEKNYEILQPTPMSVTANIDDVDCYGDSNGSIQITVSSSYVDYAKLTTSLISNNGSYGNMFNIDVLKPTQINGFEVNIGVSDSVMIYYKTGTYVGSETNSNDWIHAGTYYVYSSGADKPSTLNLNNPITLLPGSYALLLYSVGAYWNYFDGTSVGALAASDNYLKIYEGIAKGMGGPFSNNIFTPRVFSGSIIYRSTHEVTGYQWSHGNTTEDVSGINAGSYSVQITDEKGCTASFGPFVVDAPPLLSVTTSVTMSGNTGSVTSTVTGGTPTYSFLWNTGATTDNLSNVPEGTYWVRVTDANGCIASDTVVVSASAITSMGVYAQAWIYPNPASQALYVEVVFASLSQQDVEIGLYDLNGRLLLSDSRQGISKASFGLDVRTIPPGLYLLKLSSGRESGTYRVVIQP